MYMADGWGTAIREISIASACNTLYIGMEYTLSHSPWSNSLWQTHFVKQPRANNPSQLAGLGWLPGWLVDWLTGWLAAGCTGLVHGGMRVGMGIQGGTRQMIKSSSRFL